jgi:hypothetical protein
MDGGRRGEAGRCRRMEHLARPNALKQGIDGERAPPFLNNRQTRWNNGDERCGSLAPRVLRSKRLRNCGHPQRRKYTRLRKNRQKLSSGVSELCPPMPAASRAWRVQRVDHATCCTRHARLAASRPSRNPVSIRAGRQSRREASRRSPTAPPHGAARPYSTYDARLPASPLRETRSRYGPGGSRDARQVVAPPQRLRMGPPAPTRPTMRGWRLRPCALQNAASTQHAWQDQPARRVGSVKTCQVFCNLAGLASVVYSLRRSA